MISWRITSSDRPRIPPPSAPNGIVSSTAVTRPARPLPSDSRFTGVLSGGDVAFDIVKIKISSRWGTGGVDGKVDACVGNLVRGSASSDAGA